MKKLATSLKNLLKFVPLILGLFSITSAGAITYSTLNSGNWSSTTNVWSTNGVDPCYCAPSVSSGDTILVHNNIILDVSLNVSGGTYINVASTGFIEGINMTLTLNEGTIEANGDVIIRKLVINQNGTFSINSAELYVKSRLQIAGTLNINASMLTVQQGNIEVASSGLLNITNGAQLMLDLGNFINSGITNIGSGSCIQLNAGNIQNEVGGAMNGTGALVANGGNVTNDGTWDVNLKWCASGFSAGMPTAEDCGATCATPLPVSLVDFYAENKNECIELNWVTTTEINNDFFTVERSTDGANFDLVMTINGAGNSNQPVEYKVSDDNPVNGINYYRLKQTDFDGESNYSKVIAIKKLSKADVHFYPNPMKKNGPIEIFVKDLAAQHIRLVIVNSYNETIHSEWVEVVDTKVVKTLILQNDVQSGLYFLIGYDLGDKMLFSKKLIIY